MVNLEKYILEKPKGNQVKQNPIVDISGHIKYTNAINKAENPEYLYWKELKYKSWIPKNLSSEKLWHLIKERRATRQSRTVIHPEQQGLPIYAFSLVMLPRFQEFFHKFDIECGNISLGEDVFNINKVLGGKEKDYIIKQSVIEEAIASSQMEGAHTTRKVAKEMIRSGRKPRDYGELMILNNYEAMKKIGEVKNSRLSLELIFELHKIITNNDEKIEDENRGKFRREEIFVGDNNFYYHKAPDIKFVEREIESLIEFANNGNEDEFVHPICKAIMLHFWIAYLHPFVDGNGRLARCLFYWYMLKEGYWTISYLPISRMIKKSQKEYGKAFVRSEQDDYDLTYFIDYNIRKMELAIKDFKKYCSKRIQNKEIENKSIIEFDLNERQVQGLRNLENGNFVTLKGYVDIFGISKPTGIKDLKDLEAKKFVYSEKIGRQVRYYRKKENKK